MDMQNEGKDIAQLQGGQYQFRNNRLGSVSSLAPPLSLTPLSFFFWTEYTGSSSTWTLGVHRCP